MAKELVTDQLWEIVEPLLPPEEPKPKGGRPRVPNRAPLTGIVFVLKSGISLGDAPQGDGLRVRFDVLAEAARLAGGWCVAPVAPT